MTTEHWDVDKLPKIDDTAYSIRKLFKRGALLITPPSCDEFGLRVYSNQFERGRSNSFVGILTSHMPVIILEDDGSCSPRVLCKFGLCYIDI